MSKIKPKKTKSLSILLALLLSPLVSCSWLTLAARSQTLDTQSTPQSSPLTEPPSPQPTSPIAPEETAQPPVSPSPQPTSPIAPEETAQPPVSPSPQPASQTNPTQPVEGAEKLTTIPVGINIGKDNAIPSTIVRGLEDGSQAVNFDKWLIRFDDVVQALKLTVTTLDDGQLELRSIGSVVRVNPKELQEDPELGLAFSVEQIRNRLGVPTEFDIAEYAIRFDPPWLGLAEDGRIRPEKPPVVTEGLPRISAPGFTVAAIGQKTDFSGSSSDSGGSNTTFQGELSSVGTILGGSWFVRTNQSDLTDGSSWQLSEAQYFRQTPSADYVVGSHPTFWNAQGDGDYWGFTTVRRWGFQPGDSGSGGFNWSQRLQADRIGRTIVGSAPPNTLVQLTQGTRDNIIAEVLVDSSGVFRFADVPSQGGRYELLLYPNGQLTAIPEIRDVEFSSVPSQLPKGTSALTFSAGLRREFDRESRVIGDFTDFRGGVAYRYGVSEDLTLGVGTVYDRSLLGLAEIFYQPKGFPLQVSTSVLAGGDGGIEVDSYIAFQPTDTLRAEFSSDRLSSRFNINWQAFPGLSFKVGGNTSDDALFAGFNFARSSRDFSAFASLEYDTKNRLRLALNSRLGALQLNHRSNELSSNSELSYSLSGKDSLNLGHSIFVSYATNRTGNRDDNLTSLGWRYRSRAQTLDGRYLWELGLGYGFGSRGDGLVASLGTGILPGVVVRGIYEGASVSSDEQRFRLEVSPNLYFQGGIAPGDPRFDRLRNEGGIWMQPFFDRNNNGKRDRGEDVYTEDIDLMLVLNNESINSSRPEIRRQGVFVILTPGLYRLDLDPAGYPPDWKPVKPAYAVEVVAGSYTPVLIPMVQSYTVAGKVTDAQGQPVANARVEAVPVDRGETVLSVTNDAGVFYLENLPQGTYNLLVRGQPARPSQVIIDANSPSLQEVNLTIDK